MALYVCSSITIKFNKHLFWLSPYRYCDIFPSINVKGTVKHLQLMPHELEDYEKQVEKVLKRYLKRLQWLLSGQYLIFLLCLKYIALEEITCQESNSAFINVLDISYTFRKKKNFDIHFISFTFSIYVLVCSHKIRLWLVENTCPSYYIFMPVCYQSKYFCQNNRK
jgi:hypothetical protein